MPSPGEDIHSWSIVAADNGTADPLINWVEGQTRASVNNSSRSELAAHAKNRNLLNGSITTTGSANAQAFLSGVTYTSVPTGLMVKLKVGTGLTNTASTTLDMDGIGAVLVKTANGDNLLGGEFVENGYVDLLYNGTNWIFLYGREFMFDRITSGGGIIIGHQVFSTPGTFTYTPTGGMECCIVECVGGGGGGGSALGGGTTFGCGGGGGSGGYSRKYATAADIGVSQTITVGIGGTGGAGTVEGAEGGNGGTSSVGSLCIALGGIGGTRGQFGAAGGQGASAGTGDIIAAGNSGAGGSYTNAAASALGQGGGSAFGGGAVGVFTQSNSGGANAGNYGSGGSGGASVTSGAGAGGGAGSSGLVIITEFAGKGAPGRDGDTGPIGPTGPSGSGTGDVLRFGTPTTGQIAQWTDASHIQGVDAATAVGSVAVTNGVQQTFTASGTYTPTADMKFCLIECIGGGGGGGGGYAPGSQYMVGAGGGSGGYSRKLATAAEIGASQTVTIGAAGTASATTTSSGGNGGVTSVGTLCVANGGIGGGASGIGVGNGLGGAGGAAGTGDVIAAGAPGDGGFYNSENTVIGCRSGYGGSSYLGGGAQATNAGTGNSGSNYGSGGSGGNASGGSGYVGGAGSAGIAIITEFC